MFLFARLSFACCRRFLDCQKSLRLLTCVLNTATFQNRNPHYMSPCILQKTQSNQSIPIPTLITLPIASAASLRLSMEIVKMVWLSNCATTVQRASSMKESLVRPHYVASRECLHQQPGLFPRMILFRGAVRQVLKQIMVICS